MIVAGFGFRSAANADSFQDAFERAGEDALISSLATLEDKADHPAFQAFARARKLPILGVSGVAAQPVATATDTRASRMARQLSSVAEATALAAAGPGAKLIQTRVVSADRMATCALAQASRKAEQR